jgi:hypothetical protein
MPEVIEELMRAVRDGNRLSRHSIRSGVGIGSRLQVLGEDFMMILRTASGVTGWKDKKEVLVKGSLGRGGLAMTIESKSRLRVAILLRKKPEKRLGSSHVGYTVGS